jgi:hypothetical protein
VRERRNWLPVEAAPVFGWRESELREMTVEEYCARALGRFCEAPAGLIDDSFAVVDYERLDLEAIYELGAFLRLSMPPRDSAEMRRITATYAKDPEQQRPFAGDSARKLEAVAARVRYLVQEWAERPYRVLKGMERHA